MGVRNRNNPECGVNEPIEEEDTNIIYGLDDAPPWYLSIPMALQVFKSRTNSS